MGHLKECNERYGVDLCRLLKLRLMGGSQNGVRYNGNLLFTSFFGRYDWDATQNRKTCKPSCGTHGAYNAHAGSDSSFSRSQRRSWRLQATDLYEHWLAEAGEWERMIAYVNRCPRIGSKRMALVNLDVDCHEGQTRTDANQTAQAVNGLLPSSRIYWEPSTSGSGLHGYCMLSWSAGASNRRIREDLQEVGRLLGLLTSGMKAECSEARGAPVLFEGGEIVAGGTWAKVPRPQTRDQAESLIGTLEHEVSAADVLQHLRQLIEIGKGDCKAVKGKNPNTLAHTPGPVHDADTYVRSSQFCASFLRSYYRAHDCLPSLPEVWQAYQSEGMDIGNSDKRCIADAYALLSRSFDPDKAKDGAERYLEQAERLIADAIRSNGLVADLQADLIRRRRVYRNRGCKSSTIGKLRALTQNGLSAMLACMMYELGGSRKTWGKAQAQALMLKAFNINIDNKEFRACMRWLRRNRLVRLVAYQREGKCRTYQITSQDVF
jgi:hypothetical protein